MKKILFVGASGHVAEKAIPVLAKKYSIVGVAKNRTTYKHLCSDYYAGDLLKDSGKIFTTIFRRHSFGSIVWNPVIYAPRPMLELSREKLRDEVDLAAGLPVECLRIAMKHGFTGQRSLVIVTSQLAYGVKPTWCSYSIAKHGQIILADYLSRELEGSGMAIKLLALGAVSEISAEELAGALEDAIENARPKERLFRVG